MNTNNKTAQIQTEIDGIVHDAAKCAGFDPGRTEATSAAITSDGELQLSIVELSENDGEGDA